MLFSCKPVTQGSKIIIIYAVEKKMSSNLINAEMKSFSLSEQMKKLFERLLVELKVFLVKSDHLSY